MLRSYSFDLVKRKRAGSGASRRRGSTSPAGEGLRDILETIPAMTVTVLPDGSDVFIGKRARWKIFWSFPRTKRDAQAGRGYCPPGRC